LDRRSNFDFGGLGASTSVLLGEIGGHSPPLLAGGRIGGVARIRRSGQAVNSATIFARLDPCWPDGGEWSRELRQAGAGEVI
jgi:hypothetical protein